MHRNGDSQQCVVGHFNSRNVSYKCQHSLLLSRAIAHNPEKYPMPETFDPSRFFDENGDLNNDNVGYVFGFGRRYAVEKCIIRTGSLC